MPYISNAFGLLCLEVGPAKAHVKRQVAPGMLCELFSQKKNLCSTSRREHGERLAQQCALLQGRSKGRAPVKKGARHSTPSKEQRESLDLTLCQCTSPSHKLSTRHSSRYTVIKKHIRKHIARMGHTLALEKKCVQQHSSQQTEALS
eukprot:1155444-Pelagomonas_calceolata.AAC.2